MKKVLLKKFLICILIVIIASNFVFGNLGANVVYADEEFSAGATLSNMLTGLIGLITWPFTLIPVAVLIGVSDIIGALAKVSIGDITSYGGGNWISADEILITPFHILFNKVPLVDVNFFNFNVSGTILQFREAVAGWYYTMRIIASMVLLVILIYIGIRMATTSIATEKAIYKKMLVDWVSSLALLFLLHYIMLFTFSVNETLVNAMAEIGASKDGIGNMMSKIQAHCFDIDIVTRFTSIIIYFMIIFQTISFLIAYIKRMFTIGFLIVIAPLITITYSMDKIGDGKAQALNTWLKEFIYNILIQPFQCILYMVFAKLTVDLMVGESWGVFTTSNIGKAIFAILSLQFIKEGEKLIKKIFGFDKASTAGDLAVGAALTGAALIKGKDAAAKAGGALSKGKNMIAGSRAAQTLKASKAGRALNSVSTKAKSTLGKVGNKLEKALKIDKNSSGKTLSERKSAQNSKIEQLAQKKFEEAGHTGNVKDSPAGQRFIKEATEQVRKNQKDSHKNKIISGFKGAAKTAGVASAQAIGGMGKFLVDHQKEIAGMTVGLMGTGIGMAAGDFGDFSKAIAGYGMGTGFMQGWYKNSAKGLRSESEAASQLYANMTGVTDAADQLAHAQVAGMNELSKEIKEALKELKNSLKNHKGADRSIDQFAKFALSKETAGTLTRKSIERMLEANGFDGTDEEKKNAVNSFMNYGALLATQTLYNNVQSAEAMGITRESLATMIGDREIAQENNTEVEVVSESTYEERFKDLDVNSIAEIVARNLSGATGTAEVKGLAETNNKINELNALIKTLEEKDESVKNEITSQITTNNTRITNHEELVSDLKSQLTAFEARKADFK